MAHLTLAGLSEDGRRLVLVSDSGVEHTVDIDARLRSAVRGDRIGTARLGQLEIKMESTIRPRDIQARIRGGESPESVAEAAQTTVEKIMPFAGPVLAERQHVAERAQRSSVRRRSGDTAGTARTLGDAVAAQLRPLNARSENVEWDAWRREDGRWSLTAGYETSERSGTAELTFDAPGNYVVLDNEDARWLVGESIATIEAPVRADDLQVARERRLTSVDEAPYAQADAELPLGDDAIDLVSDQPIEAFLDTEAPTDEQVIEQESELREEAADAAAAEPEPQPESEPRRPAKKRGRASVPSWDEIMFGGSNGSDRD